MSRLKYILMAYLNLLPANNSNDQKLNSFPSAALEGNSDYLRLV